MSLVSTIFGMLAFRKGEEEAERSVVEQKNINSNLEKRIESLEQLVVNIQSSDH